MVYKVVKIEIFEFEYLQIPIIAKGNSRKDFSVVFILLSWPFFKYLGLLPFEKILLGFEFLRVSKGVVRVLRFPRVSGNMGRMVFSQV